MIHGVGRDAARIVRMICSTAAVRGAISGSAARTGSA